MPKRPNAKKIAAKEMRKQTALASAEAGECTVARVIKCLGFCQFLLEGPGKTEFKGLARGLVKGGGANSSTRIRPDTYVILTCTEAEVTKSPETLREIVGVANRRDEIQRLKKAGRVSRELDLDDLFDRFVEEDEEAADLNQDIWADANPAKKKAAQMSAEAASQAAELLARYRKAQAGVKSQVAGCVHAERHVALAESEEAAPEAEEGFGLWDAGAAETREKPEKPVTGKREITSKRRLAALAAAEAAAAAPEEMARALAWAAASAEFEREQAALAELEARTVPANWEDEIDIDAI
jgi:hypothetical protein